MFDSLVNIRLINKETCECQRLRKMSFWEIFGFQCIYSTKLECRPSLKFPRILKLLEIT